MHTVCTTAATAAPHRLSVRIVALKEAAISPQQVALAVPRLSRESVIGIDQGVGRGAAQVESSLEKPIVLKASSLLLSTTS